MVECGLVVLEIAELSSFAWRHVCVKFSASKDEISGS